MHISGRWLSHNIRRHHQHEHPIIAFESELHFPFLLCLGTRASYLTWRSHLSLDCVTMHKGKETLLSVSPRLRARTVDTILSAVPQPFPNTGPRPNSLVTSRLILSLTAENESQHDFFSRIASVSKIISIFHLTPSVLDTRPPTFSLLQTSFPHSPYRTKSSPANIHESIPASCHSQQLRTSSRASTKNRSTSISINHHQTLPYLQPP